MSIRLLARELYRLIREVERLERQLAAAAPDQRVRLEEKLRNMRAERDRLRRALDGSKDR